MTTFQIIIMVAAIIALISAVIGWIYGLYRLKWWVIELAGIIAVGYFVYPYAAEWLSFFDDMLILSILGYEWNVGIFLRALAIYAAVSIAVILVCQLLKAIYRLILPKYTFERDKNKETYHKYGFAKFVNGLLGAIFFIVSVACALAIIAGGVLAIAEIGGFEIFPMATQHELWIKYREFIMEAVVLGIILLFVSFGFSKGIVMHTWVLISLIGFVACFYAGYIIQTMTPLGGLSDVLKPMFSELVPESQAFYANLVSAGIYGVLCALVWLIIVCLISKLIRVVHPPLFFRIIDGFIAGVIWLVLIVAVVLLAEGALQAFFYKEEIVSLYYGESRFLTEFFSSNPFADIIKDFVTTIITNLKGVIEAVGA